VARDVAIWNNKKFVHNPILPKEDKMIKLFRAWYGQFYSQNSKQFSEAYDNLEW
jgi:cholesterol 7-desaturase